jgi:hypothetical protein
VAHLLLLNTLWLLVVVGVVLVTILLEQAVLEVVVRVDYLVQLAML